MKTQTLHSKRKGLWTKMLWDGERRQVDWAWMHYEDAIEAYLQKRFPVNQIYVSTGRGYQRYPHIQFKIGNAFVSILPDLSEADILKAA